MIVVALLFATSVAGCAVPNQEFARQLALGYEQFDTDEGEYAWRQLNARGCTEAALSLLADYASTNASRLSNEQQSEMAFHVGQALAFAGRDLEALPHFQRALALGGAEEWRLYVSAHVAFLKRDAGSMQELRARYARVAPNSMRLRFLDGFLACPNKRYMEASHCAM